MTVARFRPRLVGAVAMLLLLAVAGSPARLAAQEESPVAQETPTAAAVATTPAQATATSTGAATMTPTVAANVNVTATPAPAAGRAAHIHAGDCDNLGDGRGELLHHGLALVGRHAVVGPRRRC